MSLDVSCHGICIWICVSMVVHVYVSAYDCSPHYVHVSVCVNVHVYETVSVTGAALHLHVSLCMSF